MSNIRVKNRDLSNNKSIRLNTVASTTIFLCFIFGFLTLFLSGVNESLFFTSVGLFCLAIVLIPIALPRNYDLLSCWSMAVLSVILGCFIRGIYIGFNYPDFETLNYLYFRNVPITEFYTPAALLLVCLLACAVGYMLSPKVGRKTAFSFKTSTNKRQLYLFAFITFFISLICTILYINLTGGFDIQNISGKRTKISSINIESGHRTYGFLRTIASISILAHLAVLTDAIQTNTRKKSKYVIAVVLFVAASFLPFYASSRSPVFMFFILSLATFYFCNRRIEWIRVLTILFIAIVIFQGMSVLRSTRDSSFVNVVTAQPINLSIFDKLILNRNSLELGKTTHIINGIPQQLDYRYGATIAVWAAAFIPRGVWNDKPLISPGPIIGTTIYGNRISGVPPGMVADLYWNFSYFGVVFGGLFIGVLLGWVDRFFKPRPGAPISSLVIYLYGPFPIGLLIFGGGVGYGIFTTLVTTMFAFAVFKFLRI